MKKYWLLILLFITSCSSEIDYRGIFEQNLTQDPEDTSENQDEQETSLSINLNKISSLNAAYEASNNPGDCTYYLMGIKGGWRPTTFTFNNKVYFSVPCKSSDAGSAGWHWGVMNWTLADGMNWHDGNIRAGENETLLKTETDINGFQINSNFNTFMVDTGTNLLGLSYKYFRANEYNISNSPAQFPASAVVPSNGYYSVGFSTATPESIDASDFYVDDPKSANVYNLNDDTWKAKTARDADLFYESGTIYIYNHSTNAPTADKNYIYISTTTDMRSFNLPSSYILEDYKNPHVFKVENKIYMLAFNTNSTKWNLIPGTSPSSFDESEAVTLDLGVEIFGLGGWDDTPLFTSLSNNQPEVSGVEVLNGKVYLFYLAGQFSQTRTPANGTSGAPYDSARGIGVIELEINN